MTAIEKEAERILSEIGFIVKPHKDRSKYDPSNTVYSQYKIGSTRIDFVLLPQIAIEVDGRYWHKGTKIVLDKIREKELRKQGWRILRVSESTLDRRHIEYGILQLMDL